MEGALLALTLEVTMVLRRYREDADANAADEEEDGGGLARIREEEDNGGWSPGIVSCIYSNTGMESVRS